MQFEYLKITLAFAWVIAMCGIGLAGNVNSPSSWTLVAASALGPPFIMMRYWNHPGQSMSQSIQEVLR
jgi:hypothetical protein